MASRAGGSDGGGARGVAGSGLEGAGAARGLGGVPKVRGGDLGSGRAGLADGRSGLGGGAARTELELGFESGAGTARGGG